MKRVIMVLVVPVLVLSMLVAAGGVAFAGPPPHDDHGEKDKGGKNKVGETTSSTLATEYSIRIDGHAFDLAVVTLVLSTYDTNNDGVVTVEWTNYDRAKHSVMFVLDGTTIYSGKLGYGESWKYDFAPGTSFTYHCHQHEAMVGTLTIIN